MSSEDWPKPPIWSKDLPLIRELLTEEEYAELLSEDGSRSSSDVGVPGAPRPWGATDASQFRRGSPSSV